jgi:multidrug efflux pump subunit AcrA (membrane-fusion protein)
VPATAFLHDGDKTLVYVQRTPERFELRQVKTRRSFGTAIEIVNGLKEGERVVVLGADKMPRPN